MNLITFYETLPQNERVVVDVLRQLVVNTLPACDEKFSYGVPYFYMNRRVCLIWPASVPKGGVKEGVLFGFCYGNQLQDEESYLHHGTNKQVYYRIYKDVNEIDFEALEKLLREAEALDKKCTKKK